MSRRRKLLLGLGGGALLVVVAVAVGVWWFFIRDDAPAAVDLDRAVESLESSTTTSRDGSVDGSAGERADETSVPDNGGEPPVSLDGSWTVDTSLGSFTDFSSSFVGYRVQEELASVGSTTAVGRTPAVEGTLELDGTTVEAVEIVADMTELESDNSRRDGALENQAIETSEFPTASFVLTEPVELGAIPPEGEALEIAAAGDLTIHGVTNPVTITLEAELVGGVIAVTGSHDVAFADYDIAAPTSFAVLSVEDEGVVEMQLFFTPEV